MRFVASLTSEALLSMVLLMSAQTVEKKDLLGCWQRIDEKPDEMMRFEATRFINVGKDYTQIMPVIYEKGRVFLAPVGAKQAMDLTLNNGVLTVKNGGTTETYKKLTNVPAELDFSPLKLGTPRPVIEGKLKEIQSDLAKRIVEDQAVRTQGDRKQDMASVDADNTKFLRGLVQDLGWLDAKRFGRETATRAFLIVQHSGDLRLMQAALPEIEKDMRSGIGDPQDYALLYDRLKLRLGERQRYGSQIGQNQKGDPIVLPLEDKSKVEEYRKAIGLFPLSQYLEIMKRQYGKEVQFSD
ncbi:MAG TPA: DUF6624 domain-containing protein [Planctomycetota bacterium]|nr:DUF6624 domain-containing protein [Planctomycetota bacterium]